MSQITPLRNKIKSIRVTKKITHAVRLVSMSSYSKLEKEAVLLNYFHKNLADTFVQFINQSPDWKQRALFPDDILNSTPLIILISSNKGLCGSFNSSLFRYFERSFFLEDHQTASFVAIGSKAIKFLKNKNLGKIICSHNELTHSNFETIAREITDLIINQEQVFSSVLFYSNHMKSFFLQLPQKSPIIPLEIERGTSENPIDFEWEQNKEEILDYVAIRYLKASILNQLFQSLISENAARFLTMDKATTNADEYLELLTLLYNKSRQALITREVSELAANF